MRAKSTTARRIVGVTLAALLVAAEVFALTHPLDAAAHSGGEPCKICLSVGSFGGAAVAHDAMPAVQRAEILPAAPLALACAAVRREAPVARGPPALS